MRDFYYASGWFSPEQETNYTTITKKLKDAGFSLFEPRYDAGEMSDGPMTLERAKAIFEADIVGIHECAAMFADISFKDTGVLVEIGAAIERNMPIILFDNSSRENINIMLAGAATNCLRSFEDVDKFINGENIFNLNVTKFE